MASICNDEQVPFGVTSGHDRKTLSRRIAEMMDGELGLDNRLDQGSQFWLRLPRIESIPHGDSS